MRVHTCLQPTMYNFRVSYENVFYLYLLFLFVFILNQIVCLEASFRLYVSWSQVFVANKTLTKLASLPTWQITTFKSDKIIIIPDFLYLWQRKLQSQQNFLLTGKVPIEIYPSMGLTIMRNKKIGIYYLIYQLINHHYQY